VRKKEETENKMDIPRSIGKMCTLAGRAKLNENALEIVHSNALFTG